MVWRESLYIRCKTSCRSIHSIDVMLGDTVLLADQPLHPSMPSIEEEPSELPSHHSIPLLASSSDSPESLGPDIEEAEDADDSGPREQPISENQPPQPSSPLTTSSLSLSSSPSSYSSSIIEEPENDMPSEYQFEGEENEMLEFELPPEIAERMNESDTFTFDLVVPENEPLILPMPRRFNTFEQMCAPPDLARPPPDVPRPREIVWEDPSAPGVPRVIFSDDPLVQLPVHLHPFLTKEGRLDCGPGGLMDIASGRAPPHPATSDDVPSSSLENQNAEPLAGTSSGQFTGFSFRDDLAAAAAATATAQDQSFGEESDPSVGTSSAPFGGWVYSEQSPVRPRIEAPWIEASRPAASRPQVTKENQDIIDASQ